MSSVKFQGNPVHVDGQFPKVGDKAPAFKLIGKDLTEQTLANFAGKRKVLNIFPSVDTGVCAASVRHFNEAATGLNDAVAVLGDHDKVIHAQLVDEITHEPDYDAALKSLA